MTAATIRNKTENYNRREFSAKELAKFFAGFFLLANQKRKVHAMSPERLARSNALWMR
jgi:hypothetical protein